MRAAMSRRAVWRWALVAYLLAAVLPVRAQTIDDVAVTEQAGAPVVRLAFNATVRLLQQQPPAGTAAELFRITFEMVAADDAVLKQVTDEVKRVAASGRLPELTVTYAATPARRIKELVLQLKGAAAVQVKQGPTTRTIDLVFPGAAPAPAAAAAPRAAAAAAAPASERRYAVTLQSVPVAESDKLLPVPAIFQSRETFATNSVVGGVAMIDVNVGYFATEQEAEAARNAVLNRFPDAKVIDLAKRREEVLQSAAAAAPATAPAAPPAAMAEIETRATDLMTRARTALAAQRNDQAIDLLNQLLLLPPNTQSQEAQELIGLAWERAGDTRRARIEYELYLKLFPEGEGAQRVQQRLASLPGAPSAATAASAPAPVVTAAEPTRRITGNIAQYYFGGKARSQSLVNIAAGIDQSTLTRTTESALVTSVDLGGRYTTPESETRIVLRGTGSKNFASGSNSQSILNAAYVDYKRTGSGLAVRIGRQSPISGGLLGFFDGVSLVVPVGQGFRVDLMGGVPANTLVSAPSERMLAAMIEADNLFEHWGGDVYFIDQATQGITNRRAVGGELRYSDDRWSMYSLLDYDTLFRSVNAASVQGSVQVGAQTTVTVLLDSRKAPSLEMTNALISYPAASLKDLVELYSLDQVRAAARLTTAQAKQALVSLSRPIGEQWQLAADLRYSEIGALPALGNFEATPATGPQYGATLQLTGSNLYSRRDINTFNVSVLTTHTFKGYQLAYNNLTGLRENDLTLEPSVRLYTQNDNQGIHLVRVTPGLRVTYRVSRRGSLLGEGIAEHSRTNGPASHDTTNSIFFYLGYRYELF